MRIPRPLDETGYERELRALVYHFERDIANTAFEEPRSHIGATCRLLYRAFREAGKPITTYEANERAGRLFATSVADGAVLHNARQHLESAHWLQRCGTVAGYHGRQVLTFRAVPKEGRPERLIGLFLHRVEVLEQRRATNLCLAQRIEGRPLTFLKNPQRKLAGAEQKREIVERRLRGDTQQTIADDYGITRERVRQIVQAAAFPKPRKIRVRFTFREFKRAAHTAMNAMKASKKAAKRPHGLPRVAICKVRVGFGRGRYKPMPPLWDWWLLDGTTI